MVLLHGASMEGAPIAAPILLKHFSFGWQTLALVNSRCEIAAYDLGSRAEALLMQGMPAPKDDRPCKGIWKDAGPQAQVDAIRLQMSHALIPSVVVAGDYALGEWYGAGAAKRCSILPSAVGIASRAGVVPWESRGCASTAFPKLTGARFTSTVQSAPRGSMVQGQPLHRRYAVAISDAACRPSC